VSALMKTIKGNHGGLPYNEVMVIKQLTNLNSKQLLELEAREKEVFGEGGLNRWMLPVIARYGFLFGLFSDEKIIGLASFTSRGTPCRAPTAFLIGFWINEAHRGRGLAKKLLTEAMREIKRSGVDRVELTVDEKNETAVAIYRKAGFKIKRKLESFYGPSQDRLLLAINLLQ